MAARDPEPAGVSRLGTMHQEARRRLDALGVELDDGARQGPLANGQIVAIARALVGDARAVVMDEPTSSLTDREARQLSGIIDDLTSDGVGVVYISHRLEEIFEISDRITVLRDGRHIATEPASALDAEELVRLMVGRPLNELFSRHPHDPGEVALEVHGLGRLASSKALTRCGAVRLWVSPGSSGPAAPSSRRRSSVSGRRRKARSWCMEKRPGSTLPRRRWRGRLLRARGEALAGSDPSLLHKEQHHLEHPRPDIAVRLRRPERQTAERFARSSIRGAPDVRPRQPALGGQPAEGRGRQVARPRAERVAARRADPRGRRGRESEIYRLIDDLARDGMAILLISSELEEVLSMSDRVLVMREGRINGEFARSEATQEAVMTAATGGGGGGERRRMSEARAPAEREAGGADSPAVPAPGGASPGVPGRVARGLLANDKFLTPSNLESIVERGLASLPWP